MSDSCGGQTPTPVPGSAPWWTLCAPSWAYCSRLTYSSRLGNLKWKTEHFPAVGGKFGETRQKKKFDWKYKRTEIKDLGLCDKLQEPRKNENKMRAKQLGVPVTFYYNDIGHVFAEGHQGQAQSKPGLNQNSSTVLSHFYMIHLTFHSPLLYIRYYFFIEFNIFTSYTRYLQMQKICYSCYSCFCILLLDASCSLIINYIVLFI